MDDALPVGTGGKIGEVDRALDGCPQTSDEFDIDVGFYEGIAYLLDHSIKGLNMVSTVSGADSGHAVVTFSSSVADLVRSETAALMRRPRSCKTMASSLGLQLGFESVPSK